MISKELLLKVLGYLPDCRIIAVEKEYKTIKYDVLSPSYGHYTERINIYELANICKEFAFNEGFTLSSSKDGVDEWCIELYNHLADDINDYRLNIDFDAFDATTEPEAIFKATQWILDKKDTQ